MVINSQFAQSWEADVLPANTPIDDSLKRDLLGARRKILFVEGNESSLDKPLYSLIFPMVSVVPKGTCRDVEQAVVGSRAGEQFHWLRAFGIADGDGYSGEQIKEKRERGVYALPFYSVEAIYFHPRIIQWIALRQSSITGDDSAALTQRAVVAGVTSVAPHTNRLSRKVAKKAIRKLILDQLPNDDDLLAGQTVTVVNTGPQLHATRVAELDAAIQGQNWLAIVTACPVRESAALSNIATSLGFIRIQDYEKAVRQLLTTDADALTFVRSLFGNLFEQLNA